MKIPPVRAKLSHADRWTDGMADMTKLKFAFRNLANVPKTIQMPQNFITRQQCLLLLQF